IMRAFVAVADHSGLRRLDPEDAVPADVLRRYARGRFPRPTTVAWALLEPGDAEAIQAEVGGAGRQESDIIIGRVAVRCVAELPRVFIATIPDSVLTPPDQAMRVRSLMLDEFRRRGLTPTINVEPLISPAIPDTRQRCAS